MKSIIIVGIGIVGIAGWVGWKLHKMFDDLELVCCEEDLDY